MPKPRPTLTEPDSPVNVQDSCLLKAFGAGLARLRMLFRQLRARRGAARRRGCEFHRQRPERARRGHATGRGARALLRALRGRGGAPVRPGCLRCELGLNWTNVHVKLVLAPVGQGVQDHHPRGELQAVLRVDDGVRHGAGVVGAGKGALPELRAAAGGGRQRWVRSAASRIGRPRQVAVRPARRTQRRGG
jgi:hypothetical protein